MVYKDQGHIEDEFNKDKSLQEWIGFTFITGDGKKDMMDINEDKDSKEELSMKKQRRKTRQ